MSRSRSSIVALVLALTTPAFSQEEQPAPSAEPAPPPAPTPAPVPAPAPAPSGPPVWVNLKNGTSIQGRLVSSEPGRVVVIQTEDGWELSIGWDRVESVGAEAPKPTAPPPAAAPEQQPGRRRGYRGPRAGLRLGLGLPFGSVTDGDQAELSRFLGTNGELEANLGFQASEAFYIGVFAGYAVGSAGSDLSAACDTYDCSVYGLRLGANFTVSLTPAEDSSVWLGYGVGWSADEIDIQRPEGKRQLALGGVDFARLSGGYDFRLNDNFVAGPYAAVNAGMYLYSVRGLDGVGDADEVRDPKLKGFILLGARVMVNP